MFLTMIRLRPALQAVTQNGKPDIVDTDQGCQVMYMALIGVFKTYEIAIGKDGEGCWRVNVAIERFGETMKYLEVYLKAFESGSDAWANTRPFIDLDNYIRWHGSLHGQSPVASTSTTPGRSFY